MHEVKQEFVAFRIVHHFRNKALAHLVGYRYKAGMSTVEDLDLSFLVWFYVVSNDDIEVCLVYREDVFETRITFDDPQMEIFTFDDVVVDVTEFFG